MRLSLRHAAKRTITGIRLLAGIRLIAGICVLAVFCLIAAAPASTAAAPSDAWLIVPGQSMGALRLGVPTRTLYQAPGWGQPDRTHAAGSVSYLYYDRQRTAAGVRDDQVVLILTTNDRYRTERGVGVGQPASAAVAAYGAPSSGGGDERVLWYDAIGLVLGTGSGTVIRIGVFDPKAFVRALLADERPARDVVLTARPPKYGDAQARSALVSITLKNLSRGAKVLNPNFFTLADREGETYRYDPSSFRQADACRSTVAVRPGETGTCSLVFVIPAGHSARTIVFNDGASTDEYYF
ncbi:MAG: DUF4352 domain-containing protein [Armatimonadetes bacterium]|nr:DUF4352 domain-containing protein [Armatimonadota bacterium]